MKAQDKKMIREMAAVVTESVIEMIEQLERVQKAKEKADRKERKAKAKKAAKDRHPATRNRLFTIVDATVTDEQPTSIGDDIWWDGKNPNDVFLTRLKAGEVTAMGVPVRDTDRISK